MWIRLAARHLATVLLTVLLGGFLGATLTRMAPGFGVDERELDARFDEDTLQAIRDARRGEQNLFSFYGRYLAGLLRGELGVSRAWSRPVAELFAERIPVTLRSVGFGLLAGWALALALALPGAAFRRWYYDLFATVLSGALLCVPAAVLALFLVFAGGPARLAVALVVFPKVFRYVRNLLAAASAAPHVIAARARGLGQARILFWHVFPPAAPQILALVGVSLSLAFGASIPIEVICDSPGVGQLAWQAALSRDLPLLVNLTMLIALVTLLANGASELACTALTPHPR